MKLSKRKKQFATLVDSKKSYSLPEAVDILKKVPKVKFDETVELALKLGVDPKQSDQMVRGTVALPHGTGKSVRVACFCREDLHAKAKEAGADIVGADDLIEKVRKGEINFDVAVATPNMMKEVGTLGKILGPKGLMPNPKVGTVTQDVAKAIREVKSGRIEFKLDKQADIHVSVGKISFSEKALSENISSLYQSLLKAKPASVKGVFVRRMTLSSTMGPGIRLDVAQLKEEE